MSNNVELNDNNSLTAQFNVIDKNKELTDDEFEEYLNKYGYEYTP